MPYLTMLKNPFKKLLDPDPDADDFLKFNRFFRISDQWFYMKSLTQTKTNKRHVKHNLVA